MQIMQTPEFWSNEWENRFEHYQQDTRHAFYINAILTSTENKCLELAAGSFRDVVKLNELGKDCFGCDYSDIAVLKAQQKNISLSKKFSQRNAFDTGFAEDEFDFTYHNGFWGYFNNKQIRELAKEQKRISKQRMSFTLHNGHNESFREYFDKMKKTEPLYGLRFFTIEEIKDILHGICDDIQVIPVGKGKKYFEDDLINQGKCDAKTIKNCFDENGMSLLSSSERLLCIANVKKLEG